MPDGKNKLELELQILKVYLYTKMKSSIYHQFLLTIITLCFLFIAWRVYVFTSKPLFVRTSIIKQRDPGEIIIR